MTAPGVLVGALPYLSPEYARAVLDGSFQKDAHRAEPSEDVYQLGVLLYLMLTGRLPVKTSDQNRWRC